MVVVTGRAAVDVVVEALVVVVCLVVTFVLVAAGVTCCDAARVVPVGVEMLADGLSPPPSVRGMVVVVVPPLDPVVPLPSSPW